MSLLLAKLAARCRSRKCRQNHLADDNSETTDSIPWWVLSMQEARMPLGLSLLWRILQQQFFVFGQGANSMSCCGGSGPALPGKREECLSYKRPDTLVRLP